VDSNPNPQVKQAKRSAALALAGEKFFAARPDVYSCDANYNLISQKVLLLTEPIEDQATWEKAFQAVKNQLADRPAPRVEAQPETKEEPWPYAWCRPVRTYADVTNYPGAEYRALWFDQNSGKPTEKQRIFRELCNNIIEKENERRVKERTA
jgi:hypothetical protein